MSRLDSFLAALAADPHDESARAVFADFLDEVGPTPVRLHHLPNWLRLAWIRTRGDGDMLDPCSPSGHGILAEIDAWLSGLLAGNGTGTTASGLDHYGSTAVAGRSCFVSEPYAPVDRGPVIFRGLAARVGGIHVFSRASDWGHGTIRVLLFPPPSLPPPRRCRYLLRHG